MTEDGFDSGVGSASAGAGELRLIEERLQRFLEAYERDEDLMDARASSAEAKHEGAIPRDQAKAALGAEEDRLDVVAARGALRNGGSVSLEELVDELAL